MTAAIVAACRTHGILPVEGHFVFFTCKSPVGDGRMSQDYNRAEDADEAMADMAKMED